MEATDWRHKVYPEREVLAGDGAFLVITRYIEAPVVRLFDSAGFEIAVETEGWVVIATLGERWTLVRPVTSFARQTDLEVYVGDERVSRVTMGGPLPLASPPEHAGLSNLAIEVFERIGDDCPRVFCWSHERMTRLRLVFDEPGDDVLFFVFQLRLQGENEPFYELPLLGDTIKLESRICEPDVPDLTLDDTYCGRLLVYGRNGLAVKSTPEYCRAPAVCPATPPACEAGQYCEPLDITGGPDAGPEPTPPTSGGGGCRSAATNNGTQLVLLLGVLLVLRLVRSSTGTHQ